MAEFEMWSEQAWEDGGAVGDQSDLSDAKFSTLLHGKMIAKFEITKDREWAKITFNDRDFLLVRKRGNLCSFGYAKMLRKGEIARPGSR
jgi:hypothetical protein